MQPSKRVLIIDDDAGVAFATTLILERLANVQVVGTEVRGDLGIKKAIDAEVDVVILDAHLPDEDGIKIAAKLKKHLPSVLIILYTGDEHILETNQKLTRAGISGVVHKHQPLQALQAKVTSLLTNEVNIA